MGALSRADAEIVEGVRAFVAAEVTDRVGELERDGVLIRKTTIWSGLARMGVLGAGVDPAFGGAGLDEATRTGIMEELAYGWMALASTVASQWASAGLVEHFGTAGQSRQWLPRLVSGEAVGAISLSEPGGGSDTRAITCRAERSGDHFLVSGAKTWVTSGSTADLVVLAARTGEAISAFLVEPGRTAPHGSLAISRPFDKLGARGSDTVEMTYAEYAVPADCLLGGDAQLGRGLRCFLERINVGRVHHAGIACGVARAALDRTAAYSREREAFGRPIGQHQAIAFKLADMATQLTAARLFAAHAAALVDAGADADVEASMAKVFCSEAALTITQEALRIHGGIGYVSDLPIERYFRDAPLMAIGEGTNEIQRIVISRGLERRQQR